MKFCEATSQAGFTAHDNSIEHASARHRARPFPRPGSARRAATAPGVRARHAESIRSSSSSPGIGTLCSESARSARSARRSPRRPRRSTFPSSTIQVRSPSADLARVARCPAAPSNAHVVRAEFGALCVSQARGHVPRPMFLPLHFVTAPHALWFCSGSGRAQRVFCPKSARAHASLCGRADHTACALSSSLSAHVARTGYVLRLCVLSVCVSQVHVPILA